MRIAIVGGIFDKPESYRANHSISPETTLVDGFRARGLSVTPFGHHQFVPNDDFDIVHVHHFARAVFALHQCPEHTRTVFTTHDGHLMNGLSIGVAKYVTYPSVMRSVDSVVSLSTREQVYLTQRFALDPQTVKTISNGINTTLFARTCQPNENPSLLCVGQLQRFKGLDYLIDALPLILKSNPSVILTLVHQNEGMLDYYRQKVRARALEHAVVFAGPKSPDELANLYSQCTVLMSPSLVECFSTVVLEGMGCGCAVVATDVGGIREQLDSECGVIVPAGNAAAIARAVCELLGDGPRRARLGARAAAVAREKFSTDAMITAHIDLYKSLLSRPRKKVKVQDRMTSALVRKYSRFRGNS